MFDLEYPIKDLTGATYNPRRIKDEDLLKLMDSITQIGFAKPIIVTKNNIIVAGHQRVQASRKLGRTTVPAWVLDDVNIADEVWFNQLHNGTDLDKIDKPVTVPSKLEPNVFQYIDPDNIIGNLRASNASVRREICSLLVKYGNWGCAVVTEDGEVLSSPQYLLACKIINMKPRVFVLPDDKVELGRNCFTSTYGEFSYEHLKKETWIQSFAQPYRLRREEKQALSHLYEFLVMPHLNTLPTGSVSILDFGCGQGDYVNKLRSEGHDILGVEFFTRKKNALDTKAVHSMCEAIEHHLLTKGRFDIVIADCVVNSTDSELAENDVLTCLSALCKPKGRVYYSGRKLDKIIKDMAAVTKATDNRRYVEFLDSNGRSGRYKMGTWFYQKWHSSEDVKNIAEKYYGELDLVKDGIGFSNWQAFSFKNKELSQKECEDSLFREFNLMWPQGRSVGYGERIVNAYREALKYE